jgi:hypothetical protein
MAIVDYIAAEAFSEQLATAVVPAATSVVRAEHEELSEGELISRLEYRLDQLQSGSLSERGTAHDCPAASAFAPGHRGTGGGARRDQALE